MADINEKIAAELENIEKVLSGLEECSDLTTLSTLELAGIGALLHNLYNGIENVIKQILSSRNLLPPSGSFWHRDLLETACSSKLISLSTKETLGPYLAFRHYFVHGYVMNLNKERLRPLVQTAPSVLRCLKDDLVRHDFVR